MNQDWTSNSAGPLESESDQGPIYSRLTVPFGGTEIPGEDIWRPQDAKPAADPHQD